MAARRAERKRRGASAEPAAADDEEGPQRREEGEEDASGGAGSAPGEDRDGGAAPRPLGGKDLYQARLQGRPAQLALDMAALSAAEIHSRSGVPCRRWAWSAARPQSRSGAHITGWRCVCTPTRIQATPCASLWQPLQGLPAHSVPFCGVAACSSITEAAAAAAAAGAAGWAPEGGVAGFREAAAGGANLVPMFRRIFSDHLTPVLAYRCLVKEDDREAPSFLFESVETGADGGQAVSAAPPSAEATQLLTSQPTRDLRLKSRQWLQNDELDELAAGQMSAGPRLTRPVWPVRQGRYSIVGAQPAMEVVAKEEWATVLDHRRGERSEVLTADPLGIVAGIATAWAPAPVPGLPKAFCGGWVGYTSYDTVRYVESRKLPFDGAPDDDRGLPDVHLGLYDDVVVFDHVRKVVFVVHWEHLTTGSAVEDAYKRGEARLDALIARLQAAEAPRLAAGAVDLAVEWHGAGATDCNMADGEFVAAVAAAKEHILAGDIFQIVLSQRFERRTFADPFEVYRALRIVNPSPYMIYLQVYIGTGSARTRGSILVASSPEILCRIKDRKVVNRPLAGTRRRGQSPQEDAFLEADLLGDEKEIAEHVMLVDLGRNDVGKVSKDGSVTVEKFMEIERYSHVMHISSTVTGELKDELTCWDALRSALPVGTVSGAPKARLSSWVRAMELIDELEPTRRGPYGGGMGCISFFGDMDIALALRTLIFPTLSSRYDTLYSYGGDSWHRREWVAHLQAGAGIVADSDPQAEYQETVNKAAAMARAIDLAESAFLGSAKAAA
eukprot:SM000315S11897  [mRNA]  locus=s315:22583:26558:+ [translate_table: standard]